VADPDIDGAIDEDPIDGDAIDDDGLIDDIADEPAEDAADVLLAAGAAEDPQAARVRASPAAATRVRARLIDMSVLLGLLCDTRSR